MCVCVCVYVCVCVCGGGGGGEGNRHVVAPDCKGGNETEIVKIIMKLQCN